MAEHDSPSLTGVIDIGSNSVRLLLHDGVHSLQKYVNTTFLARGLALSGELSMDAMERTALAAAHYVAIAKQAGAQRILLFGTEAVRAAANGNRFCDLVYTKTGIPVDVISGDTEADLAFLGAAGPYTDSVAVLDIGGASSELVIGNPPTIQYKKSLPLGAGRLCDLCGQNIEKTREVVREALPYYGQPPQAKTLLGIGGTATTLSAVLQELDPYDPEQVHNSVVTLTQAEKTAQTLFRMDIEARKTVKGILPARAEILPHGIILLCEILRYLHTDRLLVSESDNLEGYLLKNTK